MVEPPDEWSRIWQLGVGLTTLGGAIYGMRHWLKTVLWAAYRVVEVHIYREKTLVDQALYIRYLEGQIRRATRRMTEQAERMEELVPSSDELPNDLPLLPPPEEEVIPPRPSRKR